MSIAILAFPTEAALPFFRPLFATAGAAAPADWRSTSSSIASTRSASAATWTFSRATLVIRPAPLAWR